MLLLLEKGLGYTVVGSSLQKSYVDHEDRRGHCQLQQGDPSIFTPSAVFAIDANPFM